MDEVFITTGISQLRQSNQYTITEHAGAVSSYGASTRSFWVLKELHNLQGCVKKNLRTQINQPYSSMSYDINITDIREYEHTV